MLKMRFQSLSFKPLFAFAALAVLTVWSIAYGAGSPNAADSLKLLWHSLSSLSLAPLQPLLELRIPRTFAALLVGAALSMAGVLLVLSRGEWSQLLSLRLVPGDVFMLLATVSWAFYSWLLVRTSEPASVRGDWAAFLMAQMVFGLLWSGGFAGAEWALAPSHITWGWPLVAALAFIAIGPAVVAYRCWGIGVQRAGPAIAGFFSNLTPLFAALMSAAFLGEAPRAYHALAFALIVGGIVVSSRR